MASIAIGDLAGVQTVTRRVTNVGVAADLHAAVTGMAGIDVVVSPAKLTLGAGSRQDVQRHVHPDDRRVNTYVGGQLTLARRATTCGSRWPSARSRSAAPARGFGTGGPIDYAVTFG